MPGGITVNVEVGMSVETALPIEFSDAAAAKVKALVSEEENPDLKLPSNYNLKQQNEFEFAFELVLQELVELDPEKCYIFLKLTVLTN